MSRHRPDLIMCMKQPGRHVGRLCEKCEDRCPICDSFVRPTTLVKICEECAFQTASDQPNQQQDGSATSGKCIMCGGPGVSDAYYCYECTMLERDRDGCPKIINVGSSRSDLWYEKKKAKQQQQL